MSRTLTGAWIETEDQKELARKAQGRTLTGAWIETVEYLIRLSVVMVAPSRVRGLKPVFPAHLSHRKCRTLTGAWIETCECQHCHGQGNRRTLTGAWIDTCAKCTKCNSRTLTGAWIETGWAMWAVG